jgi:hypothetical protein
MNENGVTPTCGPISYIQAKVLESNFTLNMGTVEVSEKIGNTAISIWCYQGTGFTNVIILLMLMCSYKYLFLFYPHPIKNNSNKNYRYWKELNFMHNCSE